MSRPYIPQEIVSFLQSITVAELGYISQADHDWKADQHYDALKQVLFEQNCRGDRSQNWYPGEVVELCSTTLRPHHVREYVISNLLVLYGVFEHSAFEYEALKERFLKFSGDLPDDFRLLLRDALLIDFQNDFYNRPRELLSNAQMAEADRITIEAGVPGFTLMQNAGQAVADLIVERVQPCKTLVLCGPGNNGGDGFVIAALLKAQGWDVSVACSVPVDKLKGDAKTAAELWDRAVLRFEDVEITPDLLVVDAVFGTGFRGEFRSPVLEVFQAIEKIKPLVIAVDIPSGVNGTTGEAAVHTPFVKLSMTFCRKKPGHVLFPGLAHCGHVVVADIGIPHVSVAQAGWVALENDEGAPDIPIMEFKTMGRMKARHKDLVQFVQTNKSIADPLGFLREKAREGACYVIQTRPDFILATPEGELLITPHAPQEARNKEIETIIENIVSALHEKGIGVYQAACASLYHVAYMGS